MKFYRIAFLLFLIIRIPAFAQTEYKVHYDKEHWTEYIEGNMPLVISVPHGGATLLDSISLRSCKGAVTVTDSRTIELAREIQKSFQEKYNLTPHIVICHLSRKNVDQNREMVEGTCGNEKMEKPWKQFHHYIDSALSLAVGKYGNSVYIDLHGHGHPNQRLELGYLLKAEHLVDLDKTLNDDSVSKKTSLNNLLVSKPVLLEDLLIGDNAFGSLIADKGFAAVPSKQDKAPLVSERFFNGGYNTSYYTSPKYPHVFGFQIESNYKGVRDPLGRPLFAAAFSETILTYLEKTAGIKLKK